MLTSEECGVTHPSFLDVLDGSPPGVSIVSAAVNRAIKTFNNGRLSKVGFLRSDFRGRSPVLRAYVRHTRSLWRRRSRHRTDVADAFRKGLRPGVRQLQPAQFFLFCLRSLGPCFSARVSGLGKETLVAGLSFGLGNAIDPFSLHRCAKA